RLRACGRRQRPGPVLAGQDRRAPRARRRRAARTRHVARARGATRISRPAPGAPAHRMHPARRRIHRPCPELRIMLIAFFVNAMEDEYLNYTTTVLAHEATRRGHEVCYITPGDFVFGADDVMRVHARFVPPAKSKSRSLRKFFKDAQDACS